jgi:hypothetical protein
MKAVGDGNGGHHLSGPAIAAGGRRLYAVSPRVSATFDIRARGPRIASDSELACTDDRHDARVRVL